MKPFSDKLRFIESTFEKTINLCRNQPQIENLKLCNTPLKLIEQTLPSLFKSDQTLKDLIGYQTHRQKRALFNAIGSIFKTLFGTLDSNDAERFNEAINKAEGNEKELFQLLKQQIQVVKTTISNFNNTITNLDQNKNIFNQNFELITNYTSKTQKQYFNLDFKQRIEEHFSLLTLFISELQNEYSNLVNAILFAKSNNLHPLIITPEQLMQQLSMTLTHLPNSANYPLPLTLENAHKYLEIISIKYRFIDDKIIFVISIPLVNTVQYTVYKLISLPVYHPGLDQLTFILPSINYLAISENRNIYTTLETLESCHPINDETLICENPSSLYFTHVRPICETELLNSISRLPSDCDVRIIHTTYEIWHKLTKPNSWIYVLPKSTDVTISCSPGTPVTIVLNNTGILTSNDNCRIYTGSTILISDVSSKESSFQSIIPEFQIPENYCEDSKIKFNSTRLHLIPLQLNNLNNEALKLASHKLDEISKIADDLNLSPFSNIHKNAYFVYFLCSLLKLLLIYVFYRIVKYLRQRLCRNKRKSNNCKNIMNCLTLNICQSERKETTKLKIDCPIKSADLEIYDTETHESIPVRRSERLAKLREDL